MIGGEPDRAGSPESSAGRAPSPGGGAAISSRRDPIESRRRAYVRTGHTGPLPSSGAIT